MTPHIYIVGQTASGKTGLSLEVAEALGAEILNTDSLLFYKGLNIGTAKPSKDELQKVTHHMVDIKSVGEVLTASDYGALAKSILESASKPLLCVGGSGFYIDALDKGLLPLPHTDPEVIKKVEAIEDPAAELKKHDPDFFKKISENDLYRVKRALQVFIQTGKPLTQWQKDFKPKAAAKKIAFAVDKEELLKRVKLRVESMFAGGLLEEVEEILKTPESKNWKPLSSVGYAQVLAYFDGQIEGVKSLKEEIVTKTMQLAKRQKTWFKKDQTVEWFTYAEYKKAKDFVVNAIKENQWKA